MKPTLLAALTLGVLAALPAAAPAATVDAGALRAETTGSPWGLTFTDRGGATVLREARGDGTGPTGTLGFRTAAGWFHARRVLSEGRDGAAYTARLATGDPLARTIAVRIAPDADGVVAVQATVEGAALGAVTATGIAFDAADGERYLGFGERSNAVDQRGNTVEHYVADGPYQDSENAFIAAFVPQPGFRARRDATYFPMPWLLSTRGYGVLVDDDELSYHRLGTDRANAWSVEVEAPRLSFRVFAGPRPADVLRRFTARTGRQPAPAAPFYFGPWYQPRRGDQGAEMNLLLERDVPLSVAQTYTHYLPCGDQVGREDAERERIARFHGAGMAITTYFNPMICTTYQPTYGEARASGALIRNAAGQAYEYRYTGSEQFFVSQFDFTAPAGRSFYARLLGEAMDDGHDGWMEDFGEYTPLDARASDGTTGTALHNRYVTDYHCGAYEAVRRRGRPMARFQRSGWTGSAPCAQIVWGGDPTTDWGFDGLESAIYQALTIGASGISRWGSDIGGFFALFERNLTPELLVRWIQFGAVSGVMRTQANGFPLPAGKPRPQISDPEILPHWRRWAKLRTQLYPYVLAADAEYRRSGLPAMRHLALAYPGDRRAEATDDAFLFGPDLLAAPVIRPGARTRRAYLPPGHWVDLWRSVRFDTRTGGLALAGRPDILAGGRSVELRAPLDELPLLARRGTVLPLLSPDVDTLAGYGDGRRQVRLRDRRDRMELLAFPAARSEARIGETGRLVSRERPGRWILVVSDRTTRTYRLQAALSALHRVQRPPCSVRLDGRQLPRSAWTYAARTRAFSARFRTKRGRLEVRACPARR